METHRVRKRYSQGVCIVITLFLITGLFGPDVFAATHDSLLNQPSTTIAAPPVLLQAGTAGASTIYANNTSAQVNVAAPEYQYVTITITNSQTSATPNPFQEMITWNPSSYTSYEASDLGNIRFYSDNALTTPLYAWLESCSTPSPNNTATSATAWIKLTSPIAKSGGTLTIYMAFLSASTDFDGNYWGTAPNLSPTYGQYDNGANVFSFYDNFNGTSLSSKWKPVISSGASIAVKNGLNVTTTIANATACAFVISATQLYPAVAETYTSSGNSILGVTTTNATNSFVAPYTGYSMDWYSSYDDLEYEASSGGTSVHSITQTTFPAGVWQVTWSANGSEYFADGAGNNYNGTNSGATIANYGIYVGQSNGVINSSIFRWARMRAYPPSNVMPSFSFGSVPFYVLNVVNQLTNAWNVTLQVYGSSNIARLSNATIGFHDGTSSNQIVVNGGSIVQSQGALYNLLGGSGTTIYVSMSNLLANATGASYLYVYLEILTPNTSTFLLYKITFVIT